MSQKNIPFFHELTDELFPLHREISFISYFSGTSSMIINR